MIRFKFIHETCTKSRDRHIDEKTEGEKNHLNVSHECELVLVLCRTKYRVVGLVCYRKNI